MEGCWSGGRLKHVAQDLPAAGVWEALGVAGGLLWDSLLRGPEGLFAATGWGLQSSTAFQQ